jgi:hypothetical protein
MSVKSVARRLKNPGISPSTLFMQQFPMETGFRSHIFAANEAAYEPILQRNPGPRSGPSPCKIRSKPTCSAAHLLPFSRERAAWTTPTSPPLARPIPAALPERVERAASAAWRSHGWAHRPVVAHLEHALGSLDDD